MAAAALVLAASGARMAAVAARRAALRTATTSTAVNAAAAAAAATATAPVATTPPSLPTSPTTAAAAAAPAATATPAANTSAPPNDGRQQQQQQQQQRKPRKKRWVRRTLVTLLLVLPAAKVAWALAPLLARQANPAKEEDLVARLLAAAVVDDMSGLPPAVARAWLVHEASDRLLRDAYTAGAIVVDYVRNGPKLTDWRELHQRGADRLLALCEVNRGVYIKLGQHVGQLTHLLPEPYVRTLAVLTHAAPVDPPARVRAVVREELGGEVEELFDDWCDKPLASASLAQVHTARLKGSGQRVAVKVQHAGLRETSAADIYTVRALVHGVKALFPKFDYEWLADEVAENLPRELDFANEAGNCVRAGAAFAARPAADVVAPTVVAALSTPRVLTMSFEEGVYVNNVAAIRAMGLRPADVAALVAEAFADQIFVQGWVHADPHFANLLVRPRPDNPTAPQLVLLDHGLYRALPSDLRLNYAKLWRAILYGDERGVARYAARMGAGDMYKLWASMLTTKSWEHVMAAGSDTEALRVTNTAEHRSKSRSYARDHSDDIGVVLRKIPRELLLILKTNDCLRAIDFALGSPVNNLVISSRYITAALAAERSAAHPGLVTALTNWADWASMELRMRALSAYVAWRAWWAPTSDSSSE